MARSAAWTPARLRYVVVLVLLGCAWLAMLLLGGGAADRRIAEALYAGSDPALLTPARIFTALGEPTVLVAGGFLVAAVLWWIGRGRFAFGLLLVILVGRALTEAQKYWIARARPDIEPHLVAVKTSSFPSGHSASSMIFYLVLALALTGRTGWRNIAAAGAILLSLLTGVSRVMLGVHWPSDVIGGWSFGMLWVLVTLPTAERLFGGNSRPPRKQL
jgi:undecaprenyl-diphosphatase